MCERHIEVRRTERQGCRSSTSQRLPDEHDPVGVVGVLPGEVDRSQQIRTPAIGSMEIPIRRDHRGTVAGEQTGEGPHDGARIGLHAVP